MKHRSLFLLIFFLAGWSGCTDRQPAVSLDDSFYFSGVYDWDDETPFLKDAATGAEYPVVNLDDDPEFQRILRLSRKEPLDRIYVELMGRLIPEGGGERSGRSILQADSLLNVIGARHRSNEAMASGFYVTDEAGRRTTLLLNGAYGFQQLCFSEGDETLYSGQWRQLARNRILLFYQEKNGVPEERQQIVLFDPATSQLTLESAKGQLIYRKEYL